MAGKMETLTMAIFRSADCVCFDVDSTVCQDEAIDELAVFAGVEKEVSEITRLAMRGNYTFQKALDKRLSLINPSRQMIANYLKNHPPRLTPGIKLLIDTLYRRSCDVYLISGGFNTIIQPVAKELNIPYENIFANKLKFFYDGSYAGFDETQPTSQQDGKAQVIDYLKSKYGYSRVVMIGDGATDLLAAPPADAFIGFGGNQIREKIKKEAGLFVTSFYELVNILDQN